MISRILFFVGMTFLLVSCGGSDEPQGCKNPIPEPMFKSIAGLSNHRFEVNGQNSRESVVADSLYLDLELYQSGCNTFEQEIRFILHGTMPKNIPPQACAMEIANIFYSLSQFDAKLLQFGQWAEALKIDASRFRYNDAINLKGSSIKAKIIKQHLPKSTILTIILSD